MLARTSAIFLSFVLRDFCTRRPLNLQSTWQYPKLFLRSVANRYLLSLDRLMIAGLGSVTPFDHCEVDHRLISLVDLDLERPEGDRIGLAEIVLELLVERRSCIRSFVGEIELPVGDLNDVMLDSAIVERLADSGHLVVDAALFPALDTEHFTSDGGYLGGADF